MQPKPRRPRPRPVPANKIWPVLALLALAPLGGCDRRIATAQDLAQALAENACVNGCQTTKNSCDADAHWDFAQCQAGFRESWRDYRFCKASNEEKCGYPFWRCAENLYGYCTNRYWECREACRRSYP